MKPNEMKEKEQKETKIKVMTGWRQQLIYIIFLNYLAGQVYIRDLCVVMLHSVHTSGFYNMGTVASGVRFINRSIALWSDTKIVTVAIDNIGRSHRIPTFSTIIIGIFVGIVIS